MELALNVNNNDLASDIGKEQNSFLNTILGKTINTGLDLGLRWLLPDFVENEAIDVKNALMEGGFKEGINTAISSATELGKSTIGIFTGEFDNISQVQSAIKNGGLIDGVSDLIDSMIDFTDKSGIIDATILNVLKQGKNVILNNVSSSIEETFASQIDGVEKLSKYQNNWKEYYTQNDIVGMEREYGKIKDKIKEVLPLENTLKQAREIENVHTLLKNNGGNLSLTNEQKELLQVI